MNLKENLSKYFTEAYWADWAGEFGHNFFDAHIDRTLGYDQAFVYHNLSGKSVLEVGGYPGLLIALYLERGCKVTAIDSPRYRPSIYLEWCERHGVTSIAHDVAKGVPELDGHFDACVMSDVLLHNEGFPSTFIGWVLDHCDVFYMLNYTGGDDRVRADREGHTLKSGFPMPTGDTIIKELERLGGELVQRGATSGRELLEFRKKQ
jgi:hypothetical protein